ncbi:MAG: hypothetical protein IPH68_15640 [Chitinophagaceae bacterium]|nr:hypothetical protein [Chitinophagaceae bacterium]
MTEKTWLDKHKETLTYGQRVADAVAKGMGSWGFIISQTIFVIIWMTLNADWLYVTGCVPVHPAQPLFSPRRQPMPHPSSRMPKTRQSERDRLQASGRLPHEL